MTCVWPVCRIADRQVEPRSNARFAALLRLRHPTKSYRCSAVTSCAFASLPFWGLARYSVDLLAARSASALAAGGAEGLMNESCGKLLWLPGAGVDDGAAIDHAALASSCRHGRWWSPAVESASPPSLSTSSIGLEVAIGAKCGAGLPTLRSVRL